MIRTPNPRRHVGRHGFSLIELLVVIAIIGVLVALLAAAIMKMLAVPPQKSTELLIQKLTASLEQQWTAVAHQAKTEPINRIVWLQCMAIGGQEPQVAMDAYVWARLIQEFPNTFAEALAPRLSVPPTVPINMPAKALFAGPPAVLPAVPPVTNPPTVNSCESSVLLYLMLTLNRRGMGSVDSALGLKEARDVQGMKVLFDGWGEPLQFRRIEVADPVLIIRVKFEIRSAGQNRILGDSDDVTSEMRLAK